MAASETTSAGASASTLVDYAKSLDCIHCGLCLQTCPTFRLTGIESSSPRGRIHLMRAVGEQRLTPDAAYVEELDFCLLCRHCESVCPAGVQFGQMMEVARDLASSAVQRKPLARFARFVGFRVALPHRLVLRVFGSLLRLAQTLRLDRLASRWRLFGALGQGMIDLPRVPPLPLRRLLPRFVAAHGEEKERAVILEGCVQPELFARVNRATVDSLIALGVACQVPEGSTCCGSLHAHNGDREGARKLSRTMLDAYEKLDGPIVVNSAGCGAHMRELHHLFGEDEPEHARAKRFAERVVDFSEFVEPRLRARAEAAGDTNELGLGDAVPTPIAWDDPCHLCHGQGVRDAPRAVLDAVARSSVVPLDDPEACCGSAGIYSILRPADSQAVFDRKRDAFRRCGARTLVTANPGCQIQWEAGLRRSGDDARVVHLAELVAHALHRR